MALVVQSGSSTVPAVSSHSPSRRNSRPMTANPTETVNTKFVVDWNNPSTVKSTNKSKTNDDDDLQEAFRRFREQRMVNFIVE
jgi:hypothetical protein